MAVNPRPPTSCTESKGDIFVELTFSWISEAFTWSVLYDVADLIFTSGGSKSKDSPAKNNLLKCFLLIIVMTKKPPTEKTEHNIDLFYIKT